MPKDPVDTSQTSDLDVSRRKFLQKGGAALAAGVALSSLGATAAPGGDPGPDGEQEPESAEAAGRPWRRPNLLFLITDQERYPQHWPEHWADVNLPNRKRLADHGLTFTRNFCNAAMCSPSRATLFTGLYASQHRVTQVLQYGGPDDCDGDNTGQTTLQPRLQTIGRMLLDAGYDVQYRGKWHINKDPTGTLPVQSPADLERHGFPGWIPPEAGTDQNPAVFGGGDTNYDAQYASQAADFLRGVNQRSSKPFALFVCLANPHDLMGYPSTWDQQSYSDIPPFEGSHNYLKDVPRCFEQNIDLPPTAGEPPFGNFKPPAQAESTIMWASGLGTLLREQEKLNYVNFYAYLHKLSDQHFGTVLDALDSRHALRQQTLVFALSDHGEMGLAHGGMREKAYNAYEETIHVPLVVSNPKLFPGPVRTQALVSLIDLMPTVATLAGVQNRGRYTFMGQDLTPIIQDAVDHPANPTKTVQDSIYFTTDEVIGAEIVRSPSHIRCLREADWKVAEYFDLTAGNPSQFELYDLVNDPLESHNMGNPANLAYFNLAKLAEMVEKLHRKMEEIDNHPFGAAAKRGDRQVLKLSPTPIGTE
jgi:arylsulfatase A-like enzyme